MRISRIPAESGKALEPRRDGKTAHNRQQPRYLAIISRRLAPLNEEWGKSREIKTSRGFVKVEVLRRLDGGSPSLGTVRQLLRFMTYHAEGVGEITVRNELQPRKRGTVKVATNAENYSIGWMTATAMCAQMSRT
jgi:hypothetical protein